MPQIETRDGTQLYADVATGGDVAIPGTSEAVGLSWRTKDVKLLTH